MWRRVAALWLSLCLSLPLCPSAAARLRLTVLHTNDVHARVEARGCAGAPRGCGEGGVARRAARVAAERAAPGGGAVLLLDAGDQYQGTVWFSRYKGQEAVHFMNLLRYDAMVKRGGGERGVIPLFGVMGGGFPRSWGVQGVRGAWIAAKGSQPCQGVKAVLGGSRLAAHLASILWEGSRGTRWWCCSKRVWGFNLLETGASRFGDVRVWA